VQIISKISFPFFCHFAINLFLSVGRFLIRWGNGDEACLNAACLLRRHILITPILHCKAKTATQLIFVTVGKSGFDFYMCKIKVRMIWKKQRKDYAAAGGW
jgi:hypothetical protein